MKPARILTIVVAAAVILIAVIVKFAGGGDDGGGDTRPVTDPEARTEVPVPQDAIEISFVYSPDKIDLFQRLVDDFNRRGVEVDGRPVYVKGTVVSSGDAAERIAAGTLQPVLWKPASSLWGRLVNFKRDAAFVPNENPSLVRTPVVIAMWEPLARALGWPDKPLGWADILRESQSAEGWAAYGHPEWGSFKLGHTNPDTSTSGLSAVAAEYLAVTGKREGLRLEDVNDPAVREKVRAIEQAIVHYGDTTGFFASKLAEFGPSYASAVTMEEQTLLEFNLARQPGQLRLAAIYPAEGTFFSDHPLITLNAPWVTAEQKAAAAQFTAFATDQITPANAAQFLFRPASGEETPGPPITADNLVDPAKPTALLSLPEPRVLARIQEAWREDRKPATVQIVLDISGSMNDEGKLDSAKLGLIGFLDLMQPQDQVGLTVFSDEVNEVTQPVSIGERRAQLKTRIGELFAEGNTAVYDATLQAVEAAAQRADPKRINAVVVLTDGQDNQSRVRLAAVVARLKELSGSEGKGVRVFTISYGSEAEVGGLRQIAQAGAGQAYTGDPATIRAVYKQIASFF
jgi:Ca-activated chloride channel family protein